MTVAFLVIWLMPMYGTSYVFSKSFFPGWVVIVSIIWLFSGTIAVGIYPLCEGRGSMIRVSKGMFSRGKPAVATDSVSIREGKVGEEIPVNKG
jgi:urea-proton symporter